jgi:hypothetical protein
VKIVRFLMTISVLSLAVVGHIETARAACPQGKITCGEWCKKYNARSNKCLAGDPNSCDKKPGGTEACVGDGCPSGRIGCAQWCARYRGNSESCLRTSPGSCMRKYGSLIQCVTDGPPSK